MVSGVPTQFKRHEFVRAFAEQAEAFVAQPADSRERFLVLPFMRTVSRFNEYVWLVARPDMFTSRTVIQAVVRSGVYPQRVLAGSLFQATTQQRIQETLDLRGIRFTVRGNTYHNAGGQSEPVETPKALQPLCLYQATGGKLAQLLF